jgi:hypothetical protein
MRWEQTPVCIGGFGVYERKVIHESKTSCFVQQDRPPLSQKKHPLGYKTTCFVPMYDDWTAANDNPSKVKQVVLL